MRLATTRGTNALLERSGARVAFLVTEGFGDLLRIGNQQRPDLFALEICKPQPLHEIAVEVAERVGADGNIVVSLDERRLLAQIEGLVADGYRHAAVTLLNSYANPRHENRVAELLMQSGFTHVSVSSALAPVIKIVPRAETTVVDAFLAPVIDDYIERVRGARGRRRRGRACRAALRIRQNHRIRHGGHEHRCRPLRRRFRLRVRARRR
jgi:5-oxoprolinase (ATP-hydrolysing)